MAVLYELEIYFVIKARYKMKFAVLVDVLMTLVVR